MIQDEVSPESGTFGSPLRRVKEPVLTIPVPPLDHEDRPQLDAALIRELQADGRASIQDLATQLGVSRDLISHRLRHLVQHHGVRVVAALDPSFAGHHLLTHTAVEVNGPVGGIAERISALPSAVFVSLTTGEHPLVFESRHGNTSELDAVLDEVRGLDGVTRVQVSTYSEVLKGFFMSGKKPQMLPDDIDHQIISVLQHNGRASYRQVADVVHLSPSSARERVQKLVGSGVIKISAIQAGGISRSRMAVGIGINATGPAGQIRDHLRRSASVDFAAQSHGTYDFIATIMGTTSEDIITELELIRSLTPVGAVASWSHLDIVKEDYRRATGTFRDPGPR